VRGSRQVLAVGAGEGGAWLVLWSRDLDANAEPSLREIRLIEYDAAAGTLSSYTAADDAADVLYALEDDFDTISDGLRGTDAFPETRWADGVAGLTLSLNQPDPRAATLLSYRLSLTENHTTNMTVGAVALRKSR
jgi:hypothetical protein